MGKRERKVSVFPHSPVRSTVELVADRGLYSLPWCRVAIFPVSSCRPLSGYCSSVWRAAISFPFSDTCILLKVRTVTLLKPVISQRLTSDNYGKLFLLGCSTTAICEVWPFVFLFFWLPLFLDFLVFTTWNCGCLFFWWRILLVVSLTLLGSSHCAGGVACVSWWSLSHSGLVIYSPFHSSLITLSPWWHLLDLGCILMTTPSSSHSKNRAHNDGLAPQADDSKLPLNVTDAESSSLRKSISPVATFSEALILGVRFGCCCIRIGFWGVMFSYLYYPCSRL